MRETFVEAMTAASMCPSLTSTTTELFELSLEEVSFREYLLAEVGPVLQQALDDEKRRVAELHDKMSAMDEEDATFCLQRQDLLMMTKMCQQSRRIQLLYKMSGPAWEYL